MSTSSYKLGPGSVPEVFVKENDSAFLISHVQFQFQRQAGFIYISLSLLICDEK